MNSAKSKRFFEEMGGVCLFAGVMWLAFSVYSAGAKGDNLVPTTAVSSTEESPVDRATWENPYPKGLRLVTLYGGYMEQPKGEREQMEFGTVGLNYYFCDNWCFAVEFTGVGVQQDEHDIAAGGGDVLLRTHILNTQHFSIYGDFAAGVLEANHRLPPQGTDFNFTVQTGVGAAIHLDRRTDFFFGLRYYHLSNARQKGPDRNPSLNAIQGYAGLMFRM